MKALGGPVRSMTDYFQETAGALEPLTGVRLEVADSATIKLTYLQGKPGDATPTDILIPTSILGWQSIFFREDGLSDKVLQQRVEMDYKGG